jgi:hypothetical protein
VAEGLHIINLLFFVFSITTMIVVFITCLKVIGYINRKSL